MFFTLAQYSSFLWKFEPESKGGPGTRYSMIKRKLPNQLIGTWRGCVILLNPQGADPREGRQLEIILTRKLPSFCPLGFSQTISYLGHALLLRRCELPLCINESAELPQWSLWLISAGVFKQSMGARNRLGVGLPYQPGRLHSLVELVPWNRFLGSLKVQKFGICTLRLNPAIVPRIPSSRKSWRRRRRSLTSSTSTLTRS
jgi:hypothetical protein